LINVKRENELMHDNAGPTTVQ